MGKMVNPHETGCHGSGRISRDQEDAARDALESPLVMPSLVGALGRRPHGGSLVEVQDDAEDGRIHSHERGDSSLDGALCGSSGR